jgi:predicted nucleic acid-binding protein
MATPRRICWDACVWIATIAQERVPLKGGGVEDRGRLCNHVIESAKRKQFEIVTSGLSLAEVCQNKEVKRADNLADFFRHDFIFVVPVDRYVGELARDLMRSGHPGLKPADAVHVATAITADAYEMHTFDDGLLNLDGRVPSGSGMLRICKPPPPPQSLLDHIWQT